MFKNLDELDNIDCDCQPGEHQFMEKAAHVIGDLGLDFEDMQSLLAVGLLVTQLSEWVAAKFTWNGDA